MKTSGVRGVLTGRAGRTVTAVAALGLIGSTLTVASQAPIAAAAGTTPAAVAAGRGPLPSLSSAVTRGERPPAPALPPRSTVQTFGWGFNGPDASSSDGTHVWIANFAANSVAELDPSTGALVNLI